MSNARYPPFFRKEPGGWVPTTVVVTNDLMVKSSDTTDLKGSDVRVANAPQTSEWSASIYGKELTLAKADRYEWALWAPLLEKAYARFAERYGPYGDSGAAAGSGYQAINGGKRRLAMQIFYGDEISTLDAESITSSPDGDLIGDNLNALRLLVQFSEQKDHPGAAGGEQTFITMKIGDDQAIERCAALVDKVLDEHDPWFWEKDDLTPALTALRTALTTWEVVKNATNQKAVVDEARKVFTLGAHPELTDPTEEKCFHHLYENLGIVVNLGTDGDQGRRSVYAGHAYNVADIVWAFQLGVPMPITSATVDLVAPMLDPMATQVVLENPHAEHEPDLDGNGPDADAKDEGRFTMTLDQAFRSFGWIERAVVDHAASGTP